MFGLPEPSLSFTLPSLHDGLSLDCRVYHPKSLNASPDSPPWQKHSAIIAHPYAPLGGSYDDPVVDVVAGALLQLGFLVGTFNFRGAQGSAGRTSWTAKAERADYMSFAAFMVYYVHFLNPFGHPAPIKSENQKPGDEIAPSESVKATSSGLPYAPAGDTPILIFGGYSYGAMITTQLPFLRTILLPFNTPTCGSIAADIRLRAQHLAEMENLVLASARAAAIDHKNATGRPRGLRMGGGDDPRKSHDFRRPFSLDAEDIRKGVAELMMKTRKSHHKSHRKSGEHSDLHLDGTSETPGSEESGPSHDTLTMVSNLTSPRVAYILVSPLQGVITNLATMSLGGTLPRASWAAWTRPSFWPGRTSSREGEPGTGSECEGNLAEAELKLVTNPTLAIYGDRDVFVSAKRLRDWASRLQAIPKSVFRAHEVSGAGHFWTDARMLRNAVKTFAEHQLHGAPNGAMSLLP